MKDMLYVPLNFENGWTIDALVDSGAYVSAIAQTELDRIKQQAPANIFKTVGPPVFQIHVANAQIEKPISTATPNFDIEDNTFAEHFVLMRNLKRVHFRIALYETQQCGLWHQTLSHPSPTPHRASQKCCNWKKRQTPTCPYPGQHNSTADDNKNSYSICWPPIGMQQHVLWHTTVKFTEAKSLLNFHSIATRVDWKTAVRITNTTESLNLNKKNTQIAEFSVVTPEQSKFIRPLDTAFLSITAEGDPDLTTYLSELRRTNQLEQQTNNFWFPTPKNPFKTEHRTPIQKRIPKELNELKEKKLNPKDDVKSRIKFLKWFHWTDTLLTETEKHAVEIILVEYYDLFARHRIDIGMNTEFKVRLTPKEGKAVYSQNLPMPIHLKEELFVKLVLMHK